MSTHPTITLPLPKEVIAFFSEVKRATAALNRWDKAADHVRGEGRRPKKFTPDGRMIGDIGEVIAERAFAIKLMDVQGAGYDAVLERDSATRVEIKMTRKGVFQFRKIPHFVIALAMEEDADMVEVVYNGPGSRLVSGVRALRENVKSTSGDHVTLSKAINVKPHEIRKLMPKSEKLRVPSRHSFGERS